MLDSGAAVGTLAKGRFSAHLLNQILRKAAALCFSWGLQDFFLWCPSVQNPSDLLPRLLGLGPINRRGPPPPVPRLLLLL